MKLKKYIDFIKESLKEDFDKGKIWKLDEEDIREYLLELVDNGYYVDVQFGFVENTEYYDYTTKKYQKKDVFTEKVLAGDDVRPAYWIQINKRTKITNEDVSDTLKFAVDIISDSANADCSLHDLDGNIGSVDGIVIKGGLFFTDDWNSPEPELFECSEYIAIFAKQKQPVEITEKQLVDYYRWKVEVEKEGKIYAEIELEDLADYMLSSRSEYRDSLIKGQEYMWDYYDITYYYPDIDSLFSYTLDKETIELLVKSLIKEFGGFEKLQPQIEKIENRQNIKTEEELVKFLTEERFNKTLKTWIKDEFSDSEIYRELTDDVANWEMSAHCDDNYKEIIDEFDEIVGDEMEFEKVEKEVTKYYYSNSERKEYKKDVTFFIIPYSNKWIEEVDSEYLFDKTLDSLCLDWLREQNFNYTLNPRISDYGDVDTKKMNEGIKSWLKRYLEKNK